MGKTNWNVKAIATTLRDTKEANGLKRKMKMSPFEKAVKKRIIELDMTLAQLSEQLGISRQHLTNILSGRRPGSGYKSKIIRLLELPEKWEVGA